MSLILCDRCSARALERFTKSEAMELTFCGHHADKNRESLSSQGFIGELLTVELVNT